MTRILAALSVLAACAPRPAALHPAPAALRIEGRNATLQVKDGRIARVEAGSKTATVTLTPAFIDSHVHLAYLPIAKKDAALGIAAVVDLASPESWLATAIDPLESRRAGPMITAKGGYPTQSWGRDGYGLECTTADETRAAVARLAEKGATVVKIPFESPRLSRDAMRAAIDEAHARKMKVAVHALDDDGASLAADLGADVLAHSPVEELSASTVKKWSGRAVISTLAAFGSSESAIANLRALREAGAVVLYGTDLGNTTTPGIDPDEIRALTRAGLDGAAIVAAGTSAPAKFWGFEDLGTLEPGKAASVLATEGDPAANPLVLAHPRTVWIHGASGI